MTTEQQNKILLAGEIYYEEILDDDIIWFYQMFGNNGILEKCCYHLYSKNFDLKDVQIGKAIPLEMNYFKCRPQKSPGGIQGTATKRGKKRKFPKAEKNSLAHLGMALKMEAMFQQGLRKGIWKDNEDMRKKFSISFAKILS